MLVKKHDFIIIICTLFCGLGVLFINDPTVCLAIALIQTIMIFKKAKISLFSILAFLLNFLLDTGIWGICGVGCLWLVGFQTGSNILL